MRTLVFLDLDDSLFQTLRKCPADLALHPAAYAADGSAQSFMTPRQSALWRLLVENGTVIPTTARDLAAFRRVDLPFASWSILNHGGVILEPDGTVHRPWWQRIAPLCANSRVELADLQAAFESHVGPAGLQVFGRIVEDFDLPLFWVGKYRDGRDDHLDELEHGFATSWVAERGKDFYIHRNGNNLAVLPRWLGKEYAVRYLIDHIRGDGDPPLTLGLGDSLADAGFLAECDYALIPQGTQLAHHALANAIP